MIYPKHGHKRNFVALQSWVRKYCMNTLDLDEAMIRESIRPNKSMRKKEEQIQLDS